MIIGIYDPYISACGGGEKVIAVIAQILRSQGNEIELIFRQAFDLKKLEVLFGINLSGIKTLVIPDNEGVAAQTAGYDLFIHLTLMPPVKSFAKKSILIVQFPLTACSRMEIPALQSYQHVLTYSQYCRDWLKRRWGVEAIVLYPPVDIMETDQNEKKPWILSVGRFQPGCNAKNHLMLIRTFQKLCNKGVQGWDYYLTGSVTDRLEDWNYLNCLDNEIHGYPIHIIPNLNYNQLKSFYTQSAIFWHATGYGESEKLYPERQEHFGMAICEAMGIGLVPFVYCCGGPLEIITNRQNGFLWQSQNELATLTEALIHKPGLMKQMSAAAQIRAGFFKRPRFIQEFLLLAI